MAMDWPTLGLVLALIFIVTCGVALLTRKASTSHVKGQTYILVVVGVAEVVALMGPVIGWGNVGWLALGFSVAAGPMAFEYYTRLDRELGRAVQAQQDLNEAIVRRAETLQHGEDGDGDTGADWEK